MTFNQRDNNPNEQKQKNRMNRCQCEKMKDDPIRLENERMKMGWRRETKTRLSENYVKDVWLCLSLHFYFNS